MKYFKESIIVTLVGLILGFVIGFLSGGIKTGLSTLFVVLALAIIETSLSFDNAVINAKVLKTMSKKWRKRFMTWGIAIAVFGMRIVFPLVIVAILAKMNPFEALNLAITDSAKYAEILKSSHIMLMGFGGAFLFMVALKYFFDVEKEVHWIDIVEKPLVRIGKLEAVEVAIALLTLIGISKLLPHESTQFLIAGLYGLITYVLVGGIGAFFETPNLAVGVAKAGLASFLYLEILDASFSFDGVIASFVLTNNIFVIAIGLGIGAMFVRSLTIMLLEKGTLSHYIYLEHGAFWAIIGLVAIMFFGLFIHIPEIIASLISILFIGASFVSSIRYNRKIKN